MATVTLKGSPLETSGDLPAIGSSAPDFRLVGGDLNDIGLADFKGKKKILNIVPSLDTGICAISTRKFNEKASALNNCVVLVISADLPFAQKRFCSAESIDNVVTLSLMRSRAFAKEYGVLLTSGPMEGILARAIVCLDENDKVLHTELVPEIAQEPDYDAAIAAVS